MQYELILTNHVQKRMSQRGMTLALITIVYYYGKVKGDRYTLTRRMIQKILDTVKDLPPEEKKILLRIMDKGGLTIVVANNTLITVYHHTKTRRFRRKKGRRKH